MKPLLQAEQAVLGAILIDPSQLHRISAWLRPGHFYRPHHAALYRALLKLHAAGHPDTSTHSTPPAAEGRKTGAWPTAPEPQTAGHVDNRLRWMNAAITEANTEVRGLTAVYVHGLVAACPRPAHAMAYGRMVLEGSIHRTVAAHATRLEQMAHADSVRAGIDDTLHHAQILTQALADLSHDWGAPARPLIPPEPPSQTLLPKQPPPTEQLIADERYLLAVLSARPDPLRDLVGWLRPEDFADPGHGLIYGCLGALHHRGEPVDELTVLWEAQRRGALADGTLVAEDVLRLCDSSSATSAGTAEYLGERIVRATLVRTAGDTGRQVRHLADNESLAPGRLIGYSLHALSPLEDIRHRWKTATTTPQPRPPSPQPPGHAPTLRAAAARSRSRTSLPHGPAIHITPNAAAPAPPNPGVAPRPRR